MSQVEIRVRPVIRHVVTRYVSAPPLPAGQVHADSSMFGSQSLGEFDSENYAEQVADAMRQMHAPREYVMVQETMGEPTAKVFYAYSEEEAQTFLSAPRPANESYRVYSRIKSRLD